MAESEQGKAQDGQGLGSKRERFAREYLIDRNCKKAAERAGYSPKCAQSVGSRLLRDPRVKAIIDAGEARLSDKVGLTAELVLEELLTIAQADIADAYDEAGNLLPIKQMPLAVRKALASIETSEKGIKVRRWDKVEALKLLGQHLGAWKDRLQLEGEGGGPVVVEVVNFADKAGSTE